MRFLLTTWGSQGDWHPFLALGCELQSRGHQVTLVGNPLWEKEVTALGLGFLPAGERQNPEEMLERPEALSSKFFGFQSFQFLVHEGLVPVLEGYYQTLLSAASEHDVLVAHHLMLAASVVAEKTGIPWASVSLSPSVVPSAENPPPGVSSFFPLRSIPLSQMVHRILWWVGKRVLASVIDPPINRLRKQVGLRPIHNAFFQSVSPRLNLQLYSQYFAPPSVDWGKERPVVGYCYWDPSLSFEPSSSLLSFLEQPGEKPWLFTLGTTAVLHPEGFYQAAVEAVRSTSHRALLLIGEEKNCPLPLPENVLALPYVPYGWIMPKCSAVAHQGGSGTLAQALRAGLPSLVCPFAFDQPDHARRLVQLEVAQWLSRNQRTPKKIRQAMEAISSPHYQKKAKNLAAQLAQEKGPEQACYLLETTF